MTQDPPEASGSTASGSTASEGSAGEGSGSERAGGRLVVRSFTGGAFQENSYLVHCTGSGRAAIVDPGAAAPALLEAVSREGLEVEAVFLTHAHLDHLEGLPLVREATDAPIHLHPADLPLYKRAAAQAAGFGMTLPGPLPETDVSFEPGTPVRVGEHPLGVRFTPGHAPGHVILYSESQGFALVGDVVFAGSIGRTDLPGGDMQQLLGSIREEVLTLPDATVLMPGHGPETTVGRERRGNPFLAPFAAGEQA
jgi:hydroxyacylglutathione hydrolase